VVLKYIWVESVKSIVFGNVH